MTMEFAATQLSQLRSIEKELERKRAVRSSASKPDIAETTRRMGLIKAADLDEIADFQKQAGVNFSRAALTLKKIKRPALEYALGVSHGFLRANSEVVALPRDWIVARNPFSKDAAPFHQLAARMNTSIEKTDDNLVVLAGLDQHVSTGFIVTNLAASLALDGRKVLVVDALKNTGRFGGDGAPQSDQSLWSMVMGDQATTNDAMQNNGPVQETCFLNVDVCDYSQLAAEACGTETAADTLLRISQSYDRIIVSALNFDNPHGLSDVWVGVKQTILTVRRNKSKVKTLESYRKAARSMDVVTLGSIIVE